MVADQREKDREAAMRLKLALITNNPDRFMPLFFPEDFVPSATQTEPQEVEVDDFDPEGDTAGEWKFNEVVDPREAERMLNEMMGDRSGSVSMADLGEWQ